ncbi:hypothetical protein PM082_011950 [Marasmius tenuissimus]|nr:hypothetical protein PM082_011950 [Marasmius tenuissimus]
MPGQLVSESTQRKHFDADRSQAGEEPSSTDEGSGKDNVDDSIDLDELQDILEGLGSTVRGRVCGELMKERRRLGDLQKMVPKRIFTLQSFQEWLEFFLQRPGVEGLFDESYRTPMTQNGVLRNTWESQAWHTIPGFPLTEGNLVFGLYID